ncbi:kinesin light chain 3 isoform X2 [Tanacetum coccineum]
MKNEGTAQVHEGTARRYCSKVMQAYDDTDNELPIPPPHPITPPAILIPSSGKLDDAERLFVGALQQAKQGFGQRYPHVASACNNLAELYRVKKAFDKIEPLYLEAISILEESYGHEDIRWVPNVVVAHGKEGIEVFHLASGGTLCKVLTLCYLKASNMTTNPLHWELLQRARYGESGGKTRVMETPSFGFHHMPSPRPTAYSSKEVMYRYDHPHLTSSVGFDPEFKKIPSDKSKYATWHSLSGPRCDLIVPNPDRHVSCYISSDVAVAGSRRTRLQACQDWQSEVLEGVRVGLSLVDRRMLQLSSDGYEVGTIPRQ